MLDKARRRPNLVDELCGKQPFIRKLAELPGPITNIVASREERPAEHVCRNAHLIRIDVKYVRLEIGVIGFKSSHRHLLCKKLWMDELVLAVPAHHKWAQRKTVALADALKEKVRAADDFELAEESHFSVVCFRYLPGGDGEPEMAIGDHEIRVIAQPAGWDRGMLAASVSF